MKGLWIGLGVLGVIVVLLLFVGGSYISAKNTLVQKNEDVDQAYSQLSVVPAAASRPDSQPRRHGEGVCEGRVDRAGRTSRMLGQASWEHRTRLRRSMPIRSWTSRSGPLLPATGAVSGPEEQPAVHSALRRTGGHREPDRDRAAALQQDA